MLRERKVKFAHWYHGKVCAVFDEEGDFRLGEPMQDKTGIWLTEEEAKKDLFEGHWEEFPEDYVKDFYDAKLPSWEVVLYCYPNAWFLNETQWTFRRMFCPGEIKVRKSVMTIF